MPRSDSSLDVWSRLGSAYTDNHLSRRPRQGPCKLQLETEISEPQRVATKLTDEAGHAINVTNQPQIICQMVQSKPAIWLWIVPPTTHGMIAAQACDAKELVE
jgi:hypothetical protein